MWFSVRVFFALLLSFTLPGFASAEPLIHQFFPDRPIMLGQPLFWTIEIRHPMWESYDLKIDTCQDLKMSIADKSLIDVAGEIRVVYKIALVPTALKTSCAASVMIFDEKGQTTVINGKRINVQTISGESEEIKNPILPARNQESNMFYLVLFSLLAALVALSLVLAGRKIYANTPTQRFLRDVRKAAAEVRKDKLPIQVWRLLRAHIVWGFDAEAFTPAQLKERSAQSPPLQGIAETLGSLEKWRYSGSTQWDKNLVLQGLTFAESLVETKSPFYRRRAA